MAKLEPDQPLRFGLYVVTGVNGQVLRRDRPLALSPKAVAVLWVLASRAGRLVSKDDLFAAVWAGTVVSEGVLTGCVYELRQALGDTANKPRYIETVHRRGYRFLPAVTATPPVPSSKSWVSSSSAPAPDSRPPSPFSPAPGPQPLSPLFVGREGELAQLRGWFDKAANGERQLVFVAGEPGIGKTTLVDAFLSGLRGQGAGDSSPAPTDPRSLPPDPRIGRGQIVEH
jgi:DNA-binding winged helix-turn-helix (wHTH) protein